MLNSKIVTPLNRELFYEIKGKFEGLGTHFNDMVINLYLVIDGARTSFLTEPNFIFDANWGVDKKIRVKPEGRIAFSNIVDLVKKYDLQLALSDAHSYLVSNVPIVTSLLDDEMYIARMLDFGCLDPNYREPYLDSFTYNYEMLTDTDEVYPIMTFVCTQSQDPLFQTMMAIQNRFQQSINKVNPSWKILVTRTDSKYNQAKSLSNLSKIYPNIDFDILAKNKEAYKMALYNTQNFGSPRRGSYS